MSCVWAQFLNLWNVMGMNNYRLTVLEAGDLNGRQRASAAYVQLFTDCDKKHSLKIIEEMCGFHTLLNQRSPAGGVLITDYHSMHNQSASFQALTFESQLCSGNECVAIWSLSLLCFHAWPKMLKKSCNQWVNNVRKLLKFRKCKMTCISINTSKSTRQKMLVSFLSFFLSHFLKLIISRTISSDSNWVTNMLSLRP